MEHFFENDYIHIYYREDILAVVAIWKRQPGSEDYREGFTQCYQAVKKYKPVNYYSDVTDQGLIKPSDREWMETVLMPKVVAEGLKNVAVVVPHEIFKEYYIDRIKEAWEAGPGGLSMSYFDTSEPAVAWLKDKASAS
jgi:hypothetical protein